MYIRERNTVTPPPSQYSNINGDVNITNFLSVYNHAVTIGKQPSPVSFYELDSHGTPILRASTNPNSELYRHNTYIGQHYMITIVNEELLPNAVNITVGGTTHTIKYFVEDGTQKYTKTIPLLTTSHGCYRYDDSTNKLILTISPITKTNGEMIYPILDGGLSMFMIAVDGNAIGSWSFLGGNTKQTVAPLKYYYIRYSNNSVYLCKNTGTYNAPFLSPVSNDAIISSVSTIITTIYGNMWVYNHPTHDKYTFVPCMIIDVDNPLTWIANRTVTYNINDTSTATISASASAIPYMITDTNNSNITIMYEVPMIPISILCSGNFSSTDIIKQTNKNITTVVTGFTYPNDLRTCNSNDLYIVPDVKTKRASHNFYYHVGENFIYSVSPGNEYAISIIPADETVVVRTEETTVDNSIYSASARTYYDGGIETDFEKDNFNIHDFRMHYPYNQELVDYYGYKCSGLSVFATDTGLYTISLYDEDTPSGTADKLAQQFPFPSPSLRYGYYGRFIVRKISDQNDIRRFIQFTADGRLQYAVDDGTIYESHLSQPYIRKYISNDKYIISIPDRYVVDSETGIVYNLSDIMDAVLTVNGTIKAPVIDEILLRLAALERTITS